MDISSSRYIFDLFYNSIFKLPEMYTLSGVRLQQHGEKLNQG